MSDQNPFQSSNATAAGQENQPQEAQQHEQAQEKTAGVDKNQSDDPLYVSPSDAIMSPASQKLSSFKQRQINKNGSDSTRRALFARNLSAKSAEESK